jgi:hypothetical protein
MKLTPVKSSNIAAVGYHDGALTVQFTTGATYTYPDVPEKLHQGLIDADSIGAFFQKNIRSAFEGTKAKPDDD